MKCPLCQHENLATLKFCGECGAALAQGAPAANSPALVKILDGVFGEKDWTQWGATLEASDIAFEAVARLQDLRDDRQMAATETVAPLEGAGIPGLRTVMSPLQVADQTRVPATRAPDLGEHTDEVLRAAGYDEAAIRRLRDLGVVA